MSLRWVSGRIHRAAGDYESARLELNQVLVEFAKRRNPYNYGLAGLDLMKLYALQGDLEDLFEIARPTLEALRGQDLHPDAREAVLLLARGIERQEVDLRIIDEAFKTLNRCSSRRRQQRRSPS